MAKKDYYIVEKNVNKILRGESSNFLDYPTLLNVKSKLKNINYKIYYPYKDSERLLIYTNKLPDIHLIEIISYDKLTHREIMGSLFGTNINYEMFGDIIIYNNHYYIYVLNDILLYLLDSFNMVGKHNVKLKEVDLSILDNYEREYEHMEIIVSSLRIDTVISRIINTSRDQIKEKFIDGDIILNYEIINKKEHILKPGDIFSIKKYGKYKFVGIKGNSKKGNQILTIFKYIDN